MFNFRSILLYTLLISLISTPVFAKIHNVPDDYQVIQEAIDATEEGDTIVIAQGEYTENLDLSGKNIVIGSRYLTTGNPGFQQTTLIDGDASGSVINIVNDEDDEYHVEISGLTLLNGSGRRWDIDDRNWYFAGGGAFIMGTQVTFTHCSISENSVDEDDGLGGGIYAINSSLNLQYCILYDNECDHGSGGGVYAYECEELELRNCTLSYNNSLLAGGGLLAMGVDYYTISGSLIEHNSCSAGEFGGITLRNGEGVIENSDFNANRQAINVSSDIIIRNCEFRANISTDGGAIEGSCDKIQNCTFNGNQAENGGAVYGNFNSIVNCTFIGNRADKGGALITSTDVENCYFMNNIANETGGAIQSGSGTFTGCSFYGNNAENGGAIALSGSQIDFISCTFYRNNIDHDNTIFCAGGGSPLLKNCIVYGNGGNPFAFKTGTSNNLLVVKYSLIEGGLDSVQINDAGEINWLADTNIDEDPQFINGNGQDFHLQPDSPCINSGDPDSDPDPDGTRADMGAFPFHHGDIEVEPDTLEFSGVRVGTSSGLNLDIMNIGLTDLTLLTPEFNPEQDEDAPIFSIEWAWEEEEILAAESTIQMKVMFAPLEEITYQAELIIRSDDPDEERLVVTLLANLLAVDEEERAYPERFELTSVYPNPFNAQLKIEYALPSRSDVSIALYDLSGRDVSMQSIASQPAGRHTAIIDGAELASGVYWVQVANGAEFDVKKVVLMK
ncbi:right-handed parallel beta-helix repeat-containing protein [Calditrichota bacterium]